MNLVTCYLMLGTYAQRLRGGELLVDDNFFVGEAGAAVPGGLGLLADGEQEADNMVGGEIDDFGNGMGIESDHGAGVVAHVVGGEHEGHASEGGRAHAFVADQLIFILVEGLDHGSEDILHRLRGVGPIGGRIGEVGGLVGTQDEKHTGFFDMRLVPGRGANLLLAFLVADDDEAVVLHVEGRGCEFGEANQLGQIGLGHRMIGIKVFDGAAALDGFGSVHLSEFEWWGTKRRCRRGSNRGERLRKLEGSPSGGLLRLERVWIG